MDKNVTNLPPNSRYKFCTGLSAPARGGVGRVVAPASDALFQRVTDLNCALNLILFVFKFCLQFLSASQEL